MKTFEIWTKETHYTCYRIPAETEEEALDVLHNCDNLNEYFHDEDWEGDGEIDEIEEVED